MRRVARFGAVAGFGIGVAVREADKFRRGMASVSTMLGQNQQMLGGMSNEIVDMSAKFGMAKEALTKGLFDILSAGVKAAGSMDVLTVATRAAIGGNTDTATSVDALTTVMNAYGMQAKDATHISDVLFQVVKDGKITYQQLAENIGKIAPIAKAAGLSLEDMGAFIAALVKVEKPERAMTALSAALVATTKQGKTLKSVLREMTGSNLGQIMDAGFTKRAAGGIATLTGNMDKLEQEFINFKQVGGNAKEAFERMDKARGLSRGLESLRAALTVVGDAFRTLLVPWIDAAAKKLNEFRQSGDLARWAATAAFAINGAVAEFRIGLAKIQEFGKTTFDNLGLAAGLAWDGISVAWLKVTSQIVEATKKLAEDMKKALGPVGLAIEKEITDQLGKIDRIATLLETDKQAKRLGQPKGRAAIDRDLLNFADDVQAAGGVGEPVEVGKAIKEQLAIKEAALAKKMAAANLKLGKAAEKVAARTKKIKEDQAAADKRIAKWQADQLKNAQKTQEVEDSKGKGAKPGAAGDGLGAAGRKGPLRGIFGGISGRLKAGLKIPTSIQKKNFNLAMKEAARKEKIQADQLTVQRKIAANTAKFPKSPNW
jgi:hypothetical protein